MLIVIKNRIIYYGDKIMTSILPTSRDHWLQLKSEDVSSTEIAALFNMSPYITKYELWHIKKDKKIIELEDNDRMKWGRRLEDSIARGFAEDNGLVIRKIEEYRRHHYMRRMGASFDYEIIDIKEIKNPNGNIIYNKYQQSWLTYGNGLLEIKKVDSLIYRDQWEAEEAPAHIEFQVQHQMEVSGHKWCAVVPLVGGNELKDFIRLRDEKIGAALVNAINDFLRSLLENNEPKPDYARDAEFIISMYKKAGKEVFIPGGQQEDIFDDLCNKYEEARVSEANASDIKKIIKAQLLEMAKDAGQAISSQYKANLGEVAPSSGKIITEDMVGSITAGRAGYRMLKITKK